MINKPTKGKRKGFWESIIGVHCEGQKFRVETKLVSESNSGITEEHWGLVLIAGELKDLSS